MPAARAAVGGVGGCGKDELPAPLAIGVRVLAGQRIGQGSQAQANPKVVIVQPPHLRERVVQVRRAARNWVDAIRSGGKPIEEVRFGHHAALVGHMCNLSYKAGKPVRGNKATRKVEV